MCVCEGVCESMGESVFVYVRGYVCEGVSV